MSEKNTMPLEKALRQLKSRIDDAIAEYQTYCSIPVEIWVSNDYVLLADLSRIDNYNVSVSAKIEGDTYE